MQDKCLGRAFIRLMNLITKKKFEKFRKKNRENVVYGFYLSIKLRAASRTEEGRSYHTFRQRNTWAAPSLIAQVISPHS